MYVSIIHPSFFFTTRNDTYEIYVRISDDSLAYIRKLMLIFALVLFSVIAVSVFVFCTVAMVSACFLVLPSFLSMSFPLSVVSLVG